MKGLVIPSKVKITLYCFVGTLLLYSLLGFFIIPAVIKDQLPKISQKEFNRLATVQDIQFNPFSLEIDIQGLLVKNPDDSILASLKQLYTNIAVIESLTSLSLKMDIISLEQPYALVKRDKQGNFNFSDMIGDEQEPKDQAIEKDTIFPVSIEKIHISNGKIRWEDHISSKANIEDIYPLNLNIEDFTTQVNQQSQLGFSLSFASGGQLNWQGEIKLNPFESHGHLVVNKINFRRVWELFLQQSVNFEILKGSELIQADYQLSEMDDAIQVEVDNAKIHLFDLQLAEKGQGAPLIDIPVFTLSGINFNLQNQNIEISQISSKNTVFNAWLNKDGTINYQSFVSNNDPDKTAPAQPTVSAEPEQSNSWNVKIRQLQLENYTLNFTDKSQEKPTQFNLSAVNLNSEALSSQPGARLPFKLDLKLNQKGKISLDGQTILEPLSSQIKVDIADIDIKDFQPYLDQFARLDVISGLFNVQLDIALQQPDDQPLDIKINGDSQIDELITRDQISNKDFLNWKQLSLNNIALNLATNEYYIDTVKLDQPYARVLIRKDKTINVNDIAKSTESKQIETKNTQTDEKNSAAPKFKIDHFLISNGSTDFSDLSLILPFSAHINHLKGSVKNISSDTKAIIKVGLNGKVENLAPVTINGKINPSKGDSEFKLDFNSMPLPLMTPYMADFAGRKIEKGNMSLGLQYKIKNQQLTASNNLLIDQLVLGDEVENPEAVSLPLELAIALLEDADGKIKLDVPITGDLDNPEFSVASIVADALVNVISKIVSSPFYAIASLIETDEDVSQIGFSPGLAELDKNQQQKLDALISALSKRPALKLEIKGTSFSDHDWPKMQADALQKKLLQTRADELSKESGKNILLEHVVYSEKENQRLLADLFIQKHPELAERSLFGTPRLKDPEMGEFYQLARTRLAAEIPPDTLELQKLAQQRAQNIAEYLTANNIVMERLFLLDIAIDPENIDKNFNSYLNLTVD